MFLSSSLDVPRDVIRLFGVLMNFLTSHQRIGVDGLSCAAGLWGLLCFFIILGVSFNSVYTQIWRVLLHLAADPYPDVSDLAMKVLNSIAYKVCACPCSPVPASSLDVDCLMLRQGLGRLTWMGLLECSAFCRRSF